MRTSYLVNDGSGLLSCSGYLVEFDTSLTCVGILPSGNLRVEKKTDEDGNVTLTFTDRLGRKTLDRTVDGERYQDTYYVYDDLGLLRYVLTPEASAVMSSSGMFGDSSSPLSAQAYVYKYDGKGRCVSKRLPGCAPILYRYDKGDVPIFSQDGEMRKRGKWMFSFRDALGRDAVNGVWPSAQAPSPAVPVVATYDGASPLGGYSVNTPVPSDCKPLSVSYYDDHSFMDDLVPSDARRVLACDTLSNYGTPVVGSDRCKGLLTGTAVYSLTDPTSKTVSSFYYDYQGRLIQSHRKEALGGDGHIHQSLTFTGKPSRTRETVALPDGRIDSLVTVRSYDGQERLVSETTSLNGRSQSVSYGYDEIGRMTGRIYGTEANPSTLTETLSYNIRDQLTGLSSSVFSMTLRYQEPTLGSVPKYNGGISEWEWNHGAGTETNAWSLSYDGVGRLTDARRFVGGAQTNSFSERSITYDRNSNALTLTRYGENAATPEEILAYSYNGNLLSGISNTGASGGGGQYTHDANGNMTHEGLSGLDIVYNEQNLTRRISSGGTTLTEYEYLADGTKLRALDGGGNGYQYRGSLIYAQTAGQTGSPVITLDCALTSAGRIVRETSADGSPTYKVQHYLRDHLGSVRSVIDGDTGAVVETNDYYPFGKRITPPPVAEPVEATSQSATSPNRWLFSGKESQSFLYANISLLDFGARMYNPTIARWTTSDPMSEKYYGISPYVYCLGNPISIIDPNGMDIWTMDEKGNVVWVKESDDHRLYYMNNDGLLSDDYVSVSDRSILDDLTKTEAKVDGGAKVSSHASKTGINDIFKVFKFASDKTKVEWAVHRNGDTYTIGTGHNSYSASSWEDYTKDKPNATLHSHPGINAIVDDETYSMGYGATQYDNDKNKVKRDINQNGIKSRKNYVYFPNSGRLYNVGYNNAIFIKNVRSYKSFYFGVLNKK